MTAGGNRIEDEDVTAEATTRSGETESFAELFARYNKVVSSVIRRILRRAEDQEDAAQDTWAKAHEHLDRFDRSKGRIDSWLARIAANTAIDVRRRHAHEAKLAADYARLRVEEVGVSSDERVMRRTRTILLLQAMQELTTLPYLLVWERHVLEMSNVDIAARHGMTPGAVGAMLLRARMKMAAHLKDAFPVEEPR